MCAIDERLLAQIHGCSARRSLPCGGSGRLHVAPSGAIRPHPPSESLKGRRLARLAVLTTGLAYLQLVWVRSCGTCRSATRRATFASAVLFHLLVAASDGARRAAGGRVSCAAHRRDAALCGRPSALLALIGAANDLGSGTWVVKYGWPAWFGGCALRPAIVVAGRKPAAGLVTTAHVAIGSLILVTVAGASPCGRCSSFGHAAHAPRQVCASAWGWPHEHVQPWLASLTSRRDRPAGCGWPTTSN